MSQIPSPEAIDPREAASAVLQAMFRRDAAKALVQAEFNSDDMWAYGCNRFPGHCGILFLAEPQPLVPIHGGQWTAVWRPPGDRAFWGEAKDVVCQQCLLERGENMPLLLKVEQSRERHLGMFLIMLPTWHKKFVHKESRKELARFLEESEPNDRKPTQPVQPATRHTKPAAGTAA